MSARVSICAVCSPLLRSVVCPLVSILRFLYFWLRRCSQSVSSAAATASHIVRHSAPSLAGRRSSWRNGIVVLVNR